MNLGFLVAWSSLGFGDGGVVPILLTYELVGRQSCKQHIKVNHIVLVRFLVLLGGVEAFVLCSFSMFHFPCCLIDLLLVALAIA